MILDTSILRVSGSVYVRIPSNMAKYFRISDVKQNDECIIEDIGPNKAALTFKKW